MPHSRCPSWFARRIVGSAAVTLGVTFALAAAPLAQSPLPRLKVSDNQRFLVTAGGSPFFWLGDTAWELFHRLNREDAEKYLKNRADRRFTVVQAVVLAELDGLNDPNAYGERPLVGNDPLKPNEAYFAHVDWIVTRANALGLYVGMLPTWGDKWNKKRMSNYAAAVGRALGLGNPDLQALHRGGFLHDIGMLAIPSAVLQKPGRLEPEEFALVKTHTVRGDELCRTLRSLQAVRPIIRHHHERLDGSGYPDGLQGTEVPLLAQIIGVVDVYDAITSRRPYQPAQSASDALQLLRQEVQRGWRQREIVDAFEGIIRSGSQETFAE